MKILTITYGYPPYHQGGYELRCRDVMEQLKLKGHEVRVLTTRHPSNWHSIKTNEPGIYRKLHHKFKARWLAEKVLFDTMDIRSIRRQVREFEPDACFLWQIATLSDMIIPYLAKQNVALVHDVADIGLLHAAKVQKRGLYFNDKPDEKPIKKAIKKIAYGIIKGVSGGLLQPHWEWPEEMRVYFNSENIRNDALAAGIPVSDARVIYAGIDPKVFVYRERSLIGDPVNIITPGRVVPLKGTRDAILLVKALQERGIDSRLTLPGGIGDQSYYDDLKELVSRLDLQDCVEFPGLLSQQELATLYKKSDICFFPSYWQSGLSAVPLEAMACGCAVITYGNENSREVILNNQTGFIIPQGDCDAAGLVIKRLIDDPDLYRGIMDNAHSKIERNFTMERYVDDIEGFLEETLQVSGNNTGEIK